MLFSNKAFTKIEVWFAFITVLFIFMTNILLKMRKKKFPPGPKGLPIVGFVPFLKSNLSIHFIELSKKYGSVFSLRLGSENVIVLNGIESIREIYFKAECLFRPLNGAWPLLTHKSVFFDHDPDVWKEQGKFILSKMKDLGIGKSQHEECIMVEVIYFLETLKHTDGKPLHLFDILSPSVFNNICSLVLGKRYNYDDPDIKFLVKKIHIIVSMLNQSAAYIFFPWIRYIPFITKLLKIETGIQASTDMDKFFREKIKERNKIFDSNNVKDFLDKYLLEIKSRRIKVPSTTFSNEILLGCLKDLCLAGVETVLTALMWIFYIMAGYPDIQKKVEKEILQVLGFDTLPKLSDRRLMPYSQSVILETIRWKTITPLNVMRCNLVDTNVAGYDIPKYTTIIANIWAVHHDPAHWKEPDSFQPERFLSEDKTSLVKSQNFMPFSIGPRSCPGELMAYMELFLYFVSTIQKFEVRLPDGVKPTFDAEIGASCRVKPHKICFIPKEQNSK